jgi:hypothetical protein
LLNSLIAIWMKKSTPGRQLSNSGRLAPDRLRPQPPAAGPAGAAGAAAAAADPPPFGQLEHAAHPVPLLRRLVSERHRQEQQRNEADARARRLQQEVDKLYAYNMERLQVESEALDLRMEVPLHWRTSSSIHIQEDKTAPLPPIRGVLLEERPRPV